MKWLAENLGTIIVLSILLIIITIILFTLIKRKKSGQCLSGCAGCAIRNSCHGKKD